MDTPPTLSYPAQLPITERVDEIATAVRDHQVVIVAGETGSGKTTQLPKICLQLGRGTDRMIGHTQPRRLAARTVADRLAEELGEPVGDVVGYQVRFTDRISDATRVKVMTDGILLTELGRDRMLRRYDTIIVDEAHERSLNIDFILGYLTWLLPRRPELKLIITSATIDPERFASHFSRALGAEVPIIEVSGRTYPVEIRYRPPEESTDPTAAISDAVAELAAEGPGDILLFLSGEREIRDTADVLRRTAAGSRLLADAEILPLFARLSLADQHRVFQPHSGRRIVLATNVAETSLTVPGIRYVVDPGTARISRYSLRLKVQRLPIEAVSQASAKQRAGRCGRVADGVCIRLYSEEDFAARPEFTEPELLRTNLASVILQMADLRLGEVAAFPFPDPPDRRQVNDGVRLLEELGALAPPAAPRNGAQSMRNGAPGMRNGAPSRGGRKGTRRRGDHPLTPLGRKLAKLPVDPRLGRMVLEADRNGCLHEVTVIAAALSIQDPRERPSDRREAADTAHARFTDERSDFLTHLNLWRHLQTKQRELSGSRFRRLCRDEFLNYPRVREWQDVHQQLRRTARTLGASLNSAPADPDAVHTALLSGLLSHIGLKDTTATDPRRRHEYLGARGARFAIAPGSALFRRSPQWVMVAELVETSRLWGRIAAAIRPEWVEPLAGHLVNRSYSEPHWERKRGGAVAYEAVSLYGVPVVSRRKVDYGRIDPPLARELFIRHAIVEGDWDTRHRFLHDNRTLLEQAEELEHRSRRRDIVVDDTVLYDFFDRRVPAEVVSAAHFDRWWKKARRDQPDLLTLSMDVLVSARAGRIEDEFPGSWPLRDTTLTLTYRFEPGAEGDGVTVHLPLPLLDEVAAAGLDWQVPGLRRDLVIALIRSLPKPVRRAFVPVPDVADELLGLLEPYAVPLPDALARALSQRSGMTVAAEDFDPGRVPDHLRMNYRILGEDGGVLAEGRDPEPLRQRLRPHAAAALSAAAAEVERTGLREWTVGTVPRRVNLDRGGHPVTAYPALVDTGDAADLRVFGTEAEQAHHMPRGTRRLLLLGAASPAGYVSDRLAEDAKLVLLRHNPHGGVRPLLADCADCAVDAIMGEAGGPSWEEEGFAALRQRVRAHLNRATLGVVTEVIPVLNLAGELRGRLDATGGRHPAEAVADLRAQLDRLVRPGFVAQAGWERLPDLHRYLRAMTHRLDKLPTRPDRDRQAMAEVQDLEREYAHRRATGSKGRRPDPDPDDRIGWMLEELRVSLFAQQLGTAYPVSVPRVRRALDDLA